MKKVKSDEKSSSKSIKKKSIEKHIFEIISTHPNKSFSYKEIAKTLGLKDNGQKHTVMVCLTELKRMGMVNEIEHGVFKVVTKGGFVVGKVDMTQSGSAFIISPDTEEDVFISPSKMNQALHGDTVRVYVYPYKGKKRPEGEIVEILEAGKRQYVGTVEMSPNYIFVVPDGKQMPFDIFVPMRHAGDAQNGDKVIVKVIEMPKTGKNPIGEIVEVLGKPGDNEVEMHAILADYGLPYKFPEEVERAADFIKDDIIPSEIAKRRDMRHITTFTIDPADAKDFDDALSFSKLPNGHIEVGVHIADVSHYVQPGSIIDKEAVERATSVYLVDRTVPMLPERLSNFLCSLRPNEDKLTYSAVFELDEDANVINTWIGRTVTHSDRRFTYEEAQEVIETGNGDYKDEILTLHKLAQKLRSDRFKHGAIAFDREEAKFEIDETGKPLRVYFKTQKESNQLIEEFMLLANKKVAEHIGKVKGRSKPKTFVYRIHDVPNPEKYDTFRRFVVKFGYYLQASNSKGISKELNQLLSDVKGKTEENLIETLAVRSMAKAKYSTENIGHYGLQFDYYTHFTSPIRRYPDVMVHRLLDMYDHGASSQDQESYEELCLQSSEMEIKASDAERASIKYKMVEFMVDKVGLEFDGIVSGVTDWGIYVEIKENKVEGMVSTRDLTDDSYIFDEDSYSLVGRNTGRRFTLGDEVRIRVLRTNLARKQLDYELIGVGGQEVSFEPAVNTGFSGKGSARTSREPHKNRSEGRKTERKSGSRKSGEKKAGKKSSSKRRR